MSDENKKERGGKPFFRINTQGELSETVRESKSEVPETEPKIIRPENNQDFSDSQTELRQREPSQFSSPTDHTVSKIDIDSKQTKNSNSVSQHNFPHISEEDSLRENNLSESKELSSPRKTDPTGEEQTSWGTALNQSLPGTNASTSFNSQLPEQIQQLEPPKTDNLETLRNYISLKEKEVGDLKDQQKQYQSVLLKLKRTHSELSQTNLDLQRELETAKANEDLIKKEMLQTRDKYESELAILKNDFQNQLQKSGLFQDQLQDLNRQKNVWKEKISEDLKRIKLKEKELENRYELLKKDTETLLDSKDQQFLELKKKTDALELELESLEERLRKEHAILNSVESKKRRLIETLKLAISLLEQINLEEETQDERKTG